MTVKELVESNACIVEVCITLRGDYEKSRINGKRKFNESVYVHEFLIGAYATLGRNAEITYRDFGKGERGLRFGAPYTVINKELNARATQPYWSVKASVIPKSVLELEVGQWNCSNAYNWESKQSQSVGYESAEKLDITVYLPPEQVKEIRIETEPKAIDMLDGQKSVDDLKGQMSLEDFIR